MKFKNSKLAIAAFAFTVFVITLGCSKKDVISTVTTTDNTSVPAVYQKIYGATSITTDGTWVYIKTKDLPDHKSAYYPASNALYEAYSGTTFGGHVFNKNPNSIIEQTGNFKIPLNPKVNAAHAATPLGPIGIALNGVPFFNQYAGPSQPLSNEIVSFDKYYGHPQQSGMYHYHVEPLYLTTVKSTKSGLMGFLLDGFPVYGPQEENNTVVLSSALDLYHGHTHATVDYPNGIYHYHFTSDAPYLNGNGFYGTAGTVTQ
ncbi:MAG: YHYH protein [Bacteroidia bacterium]|nr:YHYH protein [Bacteroidia bacterium]